MMTWLRLTQGKNTTRHGVVGGEVGSRLAARCGRAPLPWDSRGWQSAPESMPKCKACLRLEAEDER